MKLLLDTHTLLWYADSDSNLSRLAATILADPANDLFLSMASVWEMAIKSSIGKLSLSPNYRDFVTDAVSGYGITILEITFEDCTTYESLPIPNQLHRDPYDRMIVVHALNHSLSVVSIDQKLDGYGAPRLW